MPSIDTGYPVNANVTNSAGTTVSVNGPASAGKLLVAVVTEINHSNNTVGLSGFGLTWSQIVVANNSTFMGASIWAAWAPSGNPGGTLTVTVTGLGNFNAQVCLYSFSGTNDGSAGVTACFGNTQHDVNDGTAQITLGTTTAGSALIGGFAWNFNGTLTAGPSTTLDASVLDTSLGFGFHAAFRYTGASGGSITFGMSQSSGVNSKAICAAEILGGTVAPPPPPPPTGNVGVASDVEKIFPSFPPRAETATTLYGAANEFVSFQIVVAGPATVTAIAIAAFGPIGSANIHVFRVDAVPLQNATGQDGVGGSFGSVPDPLRPDVDDVVGEKRNAFPFTVPNGKVQAFWIDIHIPSNATSGTFTGAATVSISGQADTTVPITLNVWGFSIPSTSSIPSYFGFSFASINGPYPGIGQAAFSALRVKYGILGLDHRISLGGIDDGDNSTADFNTNYAALINGTAGTQLAGAKLTKLTINGSLGGAAFVANANSNGWSSLLLGYNTPTQDEPGPNGGPGPTGATFNSIINQYSTDKAISQSIKDVATCNLANATQFGAQNSIDVIVPIVEDMFPRPGTASVSGLQRSTYDGWLSANSKRELWMYQSCSSFGCGFVSSANNGETSYALDAPDSTGAVTMLHQRMMGWLLALWNIHGELYYETQIASWVRKTDANGNSVPVNPWINENNALYNFGGNGDGTLFYPGSPSYIGGTTTIPCSSMRLKAIRDGYQDYEYLRILDTFNDQTGRNLGNAMFPNPWTQPTVSTFTANRIAIGNKIHLLVTGTAFTGSVSNSPVGVTAVGGLNGVTITWNTVTGATSYNIYSSPTQTGTFTKIGSATITQFIDNSVGPGGVAWYKVTSVNASGESAQSTAVQGTVPIPTGGNVSTGLTGSIVAPSFPQGFNVVQKANRILHPSDQIVNRAQDQILGTLNSLVDAVNSMPVSANGSFSFGQWQVPTLTNGWAGSASLGFTRDASGAVRLRGILSGGVMGQPAFTLPQGFRPGANMTMACLSNGALGTIVVGSDGTVTPAAGSPTQVVLDGVTPWLAEG